ncbi:hypothetical protein HDU86_004186 [Geranomyces michiganensis]|nr:hypothetical protein HDU86_004186 [Geranomyces michiganensis]
MDIQQCAQDAQVQALVILRNASDAVQQLVFSRPDVATALGQCKIYIAQYEEGLERLYDIERQVGGASILLGTSWPLVFIGSLFLRAADDR